MKKLSEKIILGLILLFFICFAACDLQNPVIKKWWEDEPEYIGIVKQVPLEKIVYEQIEVLVKDPTVTLQSVNIINVEFILFSGDQPVYNANALTGATGSSLTNQEKKSNEDNIFEMAKQLHQKNGTNPEDKYYIILHGHANPVSGSEQEINELVNLSKARALEVEGRLIEAYNSLNPAGTDGHPSDYPLINVPDPGFPSYPFPPENYAPAPTDGLYERVSVTGYGGGRNLNSSSYAVLNRRVEMILVEITTVTNP